MSFRIGPRAIAGEPGGLAAACRAAAAQEWTRWNVPAGFQQYPALYGERVGREVPVIASCGIRLTKMIAFAARKRQIEQRGAAPYKRRAGNDWGAPAVSSFNAAGTPLRTPNHPPSTTPDKSRIIERSLIIKESGDESGSRLLRAPRH